MDLRRYAPARDAAIRSRLAGAHRIITSDTSTGGTNATATAGHTSCRHKNQIAIGVTPTSVRSLAGWTW